MKALYLALAITFLCPPSFSQDCGPLTEIHTGEGTYYAGVQGTASGNCGIPVDANDFMHCAMNHAEYDSAFACGGCIEVTGPYSTSVEVRVVDRCPECAVGDVDLTIQAFEVLAPSIEGRIDISWHYIPCSDGNLQARYKEGSSQWWTGIQFRDTKYPIAKLELLENGSYRELNRTMFNYWIETDGFDVGPHDFRVTDFTGQALVLTGLQINENEVDMGIQFPELDCSLTSLENYETSLSSSEVEYMSNSQIRILSSSDWVMYDMLGKEIEEGNGATQLELNQGIYIFKSAKETQRILIQ